MQPAALLRRFSILTFASIGLAVGGLGCAGPGPRLFPVAPLSNQSLHEGGSERWYDVDGNGRPDFRERLSGAGRVLRIGYDPDEDGQLDEDVELAEVPAGEIRDLVMVLDSIPIAMVREAYAQGRLRYFPRPTRVISPFPVMTDPCLTEFFGHSPCPAVESEYFNGRCLVNGYDVYANDANRPWLAEVDYALNPRAHVVAYLYQHAWFNHELRRTQEVFDQRQKRQEKMTTAYVVGTSALGARVGRNGHREALIKLDRFCQQIMYETHGRVRITLLSDHGHNLQASQRIPLAELLARLGYHVGNTLDGPGDVVVPEFGMVTCAAIHTHSPARVARDVVGLEGIELTMYRSEDDRVVVVGRRGIANISQRAGRFRYQCEFGDPLKLQAILDQLRIRGEIDGDGFVEDRVLFEATTQHIYPDPVYRVWRAFHGLFEHTPDVFVSILDGWMVGSATMSRMCALQAAHGNLRELGSCGFAMTMAGELPPIVRMANLRSAFREAGVPFDE